jgi:sortase (surface protein transpeptidase)
MEMQILLALHFALTVKTPFLFFQRFSHGMSLFFTNANKIKIYKMRSVPIGRANNMSG